MRLDPVRALCRPDEETGGLEILIPTKQYDQCHTDFPQETWDHHMQVALLFHELGHVLYSDFETFGSRLEETPNRWRSTFRMIYNAAEDGAVETQIAHEFRVGDLLRLLNRTLSTIAASRHREYVELFDPEEGSSDGVTRTYTVYEALRQGILDGGFVTSGRFEKIRDPSNDTHVVMNDRGEVVRDLAPDIESFTTELCSTADPTERVDSAYELYESVRPVLDTLAPIQLQRVQTAAVRPSDANGYSSWNPRNAHLLPGRDGGVPGGERGDGESSETAVRVPAGDGSVAGETAADHDWIADRRRTVGGARSNGPVSGGTPLEQSGREYLDILADDDLDVGAVRIPPPADTAAVQTRFTRITDSTSKLESELRSQLRRERRQQLVRGTRSGRLDDRRVVAAARGRGRVFSRRESGAERDYSCLLVLDRSGSMRGETIEAAEEAVTALTHTLSAVGISVGVLSVWKSTVCLEHPFEGDPGESAGRLLSRRVDGGSPLAEPIAVARRRVDHGEGSEPFILVITDGAPDDEERYRRQLERCSVPVYGIYIGARERDHSEYFDRIVHTDPGSIRRDLASIARRLFGGRQ
ncbi:vWA domain-containing protein [Halobaculum sp. EA56]|uniref:vWA domain-containing protein n=1 Tax=Halobaculum sp. EA56 TaxID=3421648 RepID=UPI003EBCD55F